MNYTFRGEIEIPDADSDEGHSHHVNFELKFKAADDETADTIFEFIAPDAIVNSYEKEG